MKKTVRDGEVGQTIVFGAFLMLALAGLVGLVFDMGGAYLSRRSLQNTADAAALAGAQQLNGTAASEASAILIATAYVEDNANLETLPTIVVSESYTRITVTVEQTSQAMFRGSLGIGDNKISARAAAKARGLSNLVPCVQPLGVKHSVWAEGIAEEGDSSEWVEIKIGFTGGPGGTNNTGLLDLIKISDDIAKGACNAVEPENDTDPGNKLGEVIKGFQDRLSAAHNRAGQECYTEASVRTHEACLPDLMGSATVQPTALVLVPILAPSQDPVIDLRGKKDVPVWETSPGNYRLAYFWVDGNKTFKNKNGPPGAALNFNTTQPWECRVEDGSNKCVVFGRFVSSITVRLEVLGCPPSIPDCVIEYDPETTVIKVVQLVE